MVRTLSQTHISKMQAGNLAFRATHTLDIYRDYLEAVSPALGAGVLQCILICMSSELNQSQSFNKRRPNMESASLIWNSADSYR